jgi:hypothetical protein
MVSKPVLSFLQAQNNKPGEILSGVLQGIESMQPSVQKWIVSVVMRHEISVKGFALSNLPKYWQRILVKLRWFRKLVWDGPATTSTKIFIPRKQGQGWVREGYEQVSVEEIKALPLASRDVEQLVGRPPVPEVSALADRMCAERQLLNVNRWLGVKVQPIEKKVDRKAYRARIKEEDTKLPDLTYIGVRTRWGFLWPRDVYELFDELGWLMPDNPDAGQMNLVYSPYVVLIHNFKVLRRSPRTFSRPKRSSNDPRWSPFTPEYNFL